MIERGYTAVQVGKIHKLGQIKIASLSARTVPNRMWLKHNALKNTGYNLASNAVIAR